MQIGVASPPDDVCTRSGISTTVCKYSATGYAFVVDVPVCTTVPIDVSMFISCHVSDGAGTFLHFSTGDYFAIGSWPP